LPIAIAFYAIRYKNLDHTRLSSSRIIWRWILFRPWNMG